MFSPLSPPSWVVAGWISAVCRYVGPWQEFQLAKMRSEMAAHALEASKGRANRSNSAPGEQLKEHWDPRTVRQCFLLSTG